jgi:hypothetical protein
MIVIFIFFGAKKNQGSNFSWQKQNPSSSDLSK